MRNILLIAVLVLFILSAIFIGTGTVSEHEGVGPDEVGLFGVIVSIALFTVWLAGKNVTGRYILVLALVLCILSLITMVIVGFGGEGGLGLGLLGFLGLIPAAVLFLVWLVTWLVVKTARKVGTWRTSKKSREEP